MLSGIFVLSGFDHAQEITIFNEPNTKSENTTPTFTIFQKIQEAKILLSKSQPLLFETKNKKQTGELVKKQVALAILNKNTGEIFEQRFWVSENEIKNYKKTGTINIEQIPSQTSIDIKWWNSFNTDYAINGHPELVVVANKYLFPSKYLAGLPEKTNNYYTDIIYVPYSKQLHIPELIEAGKNYLAKSIEQAFAELDANQAKSNYAPKILVTESISKDFIRNIILVEHIDPDGFALANDNGKELSERVLVVIGANQESAYRYTGSPAGASGLAQFIKPTYKNLVAKYPKTLLTKDYNAGMADHINAIKAMVLFFDSHKKELMEKVSRKDIAKSLGISEEMLAATYNGGPTKVARSINKYGLAWLSAQINLPRKGMVFRQETLYYLKKFQAVKNLDLFAKF